MVLNFLLCIQPRTVNFMVENLIDKNAPTRIDGIALALENCKAQIASLKKNELILEQAIVDAVGVKCEGSHTKKTQFFKVTTTGKLSRTVDQEKVEALRAMIPAEAFESLFNFKPSLNTKSLRDIKELHPEIYAIIQTAITSKAAKPYIKVARL